MVRNPTEHVGIRFSKLAVIAPSREVTWRHFGGLQGLVLCWALVRSREGKDPPAAVRSAGLQAACRCPNSRAEGHSPQVLHASAPAARPGPAWVAAAGGKVAAQNFTPCVKLLFIKKRESLAF